MENKKLLVLYLGVEGIEFFDKYLDDIRRNIESSIGDNYNCIILPQYTSRINKIECIDPKYITKEELIKENEMALIKLTKKITESI